MSDCEYCGTPLTEDGANATDGSHHYAAQCLEYAHAAMRAYKRESIDADERISDLETEMSTMVSARDLTIRDLRAALAAERALADALVEAIKWDWASDNMSPPAVNAVLGAIDAIEKARSPVTPIRKDGTER